MIKKSLTIIAAMICVTLLITTIGGCNGDTVSDGILTGDIEETTSDTLPDSDTETEGETERETEIAKPISLKINGVDISEYKIVYATSFLRSQCYEDYSIYAKELAESIEKMTGVRLETAPDTVASSQYEILLGVASRVQCLQYMRADTMLKNDDCRVKYDDGKLLLGANCLAGVADAAEIFLEHVATESVRAADGAVNIPTDFDISTQKHVTRIICIGDSITQGVGATDDVKYSYPAMLQAELGHEYDVMNYGRSGATMCSYAVDFYAARSYIATTDYTDAVASASTADVVVIMLGTNDASCSSPDITPLLENNFSKFATDYKMCLTKMVTDLRAKNKDIKIVLFDAPVCYHTSWEANYVKYLRPYQKQVAEELGIEFHSIFAYTDANMTVNDFPDKLHPNNTGYAKLAKGAAKALEEVFGIESAKI